MLCQSSGWWKQCPRVVCLDVSSIGVCTRVTCVAVMTLRAILVTERLTLCHFAGAEATDLECRHWQG